MSLLIIAIITYAGVFSLVYQIYIDRKKRVSLGIVTDGASPGAPVPKESALRKLLKAFIFLGEFKAIRYLTGRAVPSRLVMAGSPLNIIEFSIMKILTMILFAILAGIITGRNDKLIIFIILGLAAGFILPEFWLGLKIKRRHREIRHDLPLVIDLLNLCVGAGLDFMLAVNRVMRDFKKCPLLDELAEVWRETKMGASRREALQHLARRVNLLELSSFVRTLLQADRMGSPMGEALKIQAEEIRQRRYLQGEEAALKAPIKLLFPLFVFILPVVLVIVAGPILIQFMRGGGIKF
jgi:tight adherence protein C